MTRSPMTTAFAAIAAVALAVPAIAAPAQASTTPASQEAKPLSKKALKMVWCVAPKGAGPDAKKECKSREKWIKEGKDPFAAN
jgi:hypothetical protein